MDTILKYIFYIALIFIIYLIVAGFYEGKISKNSTISDVTSEVSTNAKKIITNTYDDAKTEEENLENQNDNNQKNTANDNNAPK